MFSILIILVQARHLELIEIRRSESREVVGGQRSLTLRRLSGSLHISRRQRSRFFTTLGRLSQLSRHFSRSFCTMSAPYAKEQQIAIAAVLKASLVAGKVQNELIGTGGVQKSDKSPVTGKSEMLPLYINSTSWNNAKVGGRRRRAQQREGLKGTFQRELERCRGRGAPPIYSFL